jgi:hypothetical protein
MSPEPLQQLPVEFGIEAAMHLRRLSGKVRDIARADYPSDPGILLWIPNIELVREDPWSIGEAAAHPLRQISLPLPRFRIQTVDALQQLVKTGFRHLLTHPDRSRAINTANSVLEEIPSLP